MPRASALALRAASRHGEQNQEIQAT